MSEYDEVRRSALIVTDMFNTYDHEDAEALTDSVEAVVEPIASLVARAREEQVELVYVNDNYGDWSASKHDLIENAMKGERPDLVEPVLPPEGVSFVSKARHSIFYGTPLEWLLSQKGIDHVVLVGQVTEQCILYSALDAYVRELKITVPRDGVAHIHDHLAEAAFEMMEVNMDAELSPCSACTLRAPAPEARS
jgi:nicotinamidase-related amidase